MRVILLLLIFIAPGTLAQSPFHVAGLVTDERDLPMPGCHVKIDTGATLTDTKGRFIFNQLTSDTIRLTISFLGYHTFDTVLIANGHHHLRVRMIPSEIVLEEVEVKSTMVNRAPNLSRVSLDAMQVNRQLQGTLVNTLDREAGFNAINIGVSASKPVIRGMGFNRVVVVHNGIKQEGQQWGADHGLEIDPFLPERVEIIKGAASLEHGSGAIGGILEINTNRVPPAGISGSLQLLGRSINQAYGGSLMVQGSNNGLFFKTRGTVIDYGDYNIPANNIVYLTRVIPIIGQRLKNSAGREQNLFFMGGVRGESWRTSLSASRYDLKTGFFPGSHGIPDLSRVQDDGNRRNVGMPFQNVEHLKITSNSIVQTPHSMISANFGFQANLRQEWSLFHTHFPNQQPPVDNRDLELDFGLRTVSGNVTWNYRFTGKHSMTTGIEGYRQINKVGGYGFLLPNFESVSAGVFKRHDYQFNSSWSFNAGIRYDKARIDIEPFFDPVLHEFMLSTGRSHETANFYAQRARGVKRGFGSHSWLAGIQFNPGQIFSLSANVGQSFRVPTAGELAANGIHHGSFRHETGNSNLEPEQGFFADARLQIDTGNRSVRVTPYLYRFSNFIFLSPTAQWSHLPHAGQIYQYMQSGAVIAGAEITYHQSFNQYVAIEINGEWIHNYQIPTYQLGAFPLPFSPPANIFGEITYSLKPREQGESIQFNLNGNLVAGQNRVARNEATTPGYFIIGAGIFIPANIGNIPVEISLQGNNLLNKKHFNHISFYRKLEIPEPGRDIQITVKTRF